MFLDLDKTLNRKSYQLMIELYSNYIIYVLHKIKSNYKKLKNISIIQKFNNILFLYLIFSNLMSLNINVLVLIYIYI